MHFWIEIFSSPVFLIFLFTAPILMEVVSFYRYKNATPEERERMNKQMALRIYMDEQTDHLGFWLLDNFAHRD